MNKTNSNLYKTATSSSPTPPWAQPTSTVLQPSTNPLSCSRTLTTFSPCVTSKQPSKTLFWSANRSTTSMALQRSNCTATTTTLACNVVDGLSGGKGTRAMSSGLGKIGLHQMPHRCLMRYSRCRSHQR